MYNNVYIDVTGIYDEIDDILTMYEDHGDQHLVKLSTEELYEIGGTPTGAELSEAKKVAKTVVTIYLSVVKKGKPE